MAVSVARRNPSGCGASPPQTDQIMPDCQSIDGAKNEFSKLIMQVKQTHRFAVLTLLIIVPPAYPQP